MKAAGGDMSAGEVLHFGQSSSIEAIDGWLDTAYHRSPLIDPNTTEIGVGLYKGNAVINMTSSSESAKEQIAIFPYNQMKDVKIGFYGREVPNPLEQFKLEKSGYILSFGPNFWVENITATLKDSKGNQILLLVEEGVEYYFFPTYELAFDEKYTMEVAYYKSGAKKRLTKKWTFTTEKPNLTEFTDYNPGVKINNKYISYVYCINRNNMMYLSSADLLTRFNYEVVVDKKTKGITLTSPTNSIVMQAGSLKAKKNKNSIALKNRPIYENGEIFIPFSILKDLFGISVQFDKKTNVINFSGKSQTFTEPMLKYTTVNRGKVDKVKDYLTKSLANTGYRFESMNLAFDKSTVEYKIFNASNEVVADLSQYNYDDADDVLNIYINDSMSRYMDEQLIKALQHLIELTTKNDAHQFATRVEQNFDHPPAMNSDTPWDRWNVNKQTEVNMYYTYPSYSDTYDMKVWGIEISMYAKLK